MKFCSGRQRVTKGFTLVELLVAVAMTGIVMTVMFTMFRTSSRSYTLQDYVAETQQNLRIGMYNLDRDVRMAGCGMNLLPALVSGIQVFNGSSWINMNSITATNSSTGPDSIEIFYGDINSGEYDASITQAMPDASAVLNVDDTSSFNINDMVVISNGVTAALFVVSQILDPPGKLQHNPAQSPFNPPAAFKSFPSGGGYGVGSLLFNFGGAKWLTYSIDSATDPAHPKLIVDMHDGNPPQVVADNIEDMQFFYFMSQGVADTDNPTGNETKITAVRITLVARTAEPDRESLVFNPRTIEDHSPGAAPADGYRRKVLSTTVKKRN